MVERTLIIIKPDAVQRHLAGQIISRFEQKGLKVVAAKFLHISKETAEKHYAVHKDKPFFAGVVNYLSSAPVWVMVLQTEDVIKMTRKMMGATFGYDAEPGTIRGDMSCSRGYNLVHGSDSPESADYEIPLYFKPEEITSYDFDDEKWLYGKND
jgi:nucleoside-diphosphate kinase